MKLRLFFTALATFALLAIAGAASAQDKAAVEKGKQLYATKLCSACHSIEGKGNPKGPLDNVAAKLTADEIRAWIVTPKEMTEKTKSLRKPNMGVTPGLSKADVDALVAYMMTLKK